MKAQRESRGIPLLFLNLNGRWVTVVTARPDTDSTVDCVGAAPVLHGCGRSRPTRPRRRCKNNIMGDVDADSRLDYMLLYGRLWSCISQDTCEGRQKTPARYLGTVSFV